MRSCYEEYAAERRPGFLLSLELGQAYAIDAERDRQCLGPIGDSYFREAVRYYLFGYRDEADELVAKFEGFLSLALAVGEKQRYDYSRGFSEGLRSTALSYLHWLRTGEAHVEALADAREQLSHYFRYSRSIDRVSANLMAARLLYLEAYDLIRLIAERLARSPKATARPGGLFGDALRIAQAGQTAERDSLKAKVRQRMPLHLFRWMHRGHYDDVAFVLHALFPRPAGPPSRLIEEALDHFPEIERIGGYLNWDIKR